MHLLAGGISRIDGIILAVLCAAICLFVLLDIILVLSLHRQNKKLAEAEEKPAPPEDAEVKDNN